MPVDKVLRVKMLCFLIFGISATAIIEQKKLMEHPEIVTDLLRDIDQELAYLNSNVTNSLTETLIVTLMRTSLLYVYLVMTLYYIILMEAEDVLSRLMAVLGKFMVFITVSTYLAAEYFLPTREMYIVITRLAIILFILSSLQIIHWIISVCQAYISWSKIKESIKKYWEIANIFFWSRSRYVPRLEDTPV